jgi:hypothetical protein
VRRMALREKRDIHVNLLRRDMKVEMFKCPPASSFQHQAVEGSWMQSCMKNLEGFFLKLLGMKAQNLCQSFVIRITERRDSGGRLWRNVGSEEI